MSDIGIRKCKTISRYHAQLAKRQLNLRSKRTPWQKILQNCKSRCHSFQLRVRRSTSMNCNGTSMVLRAKKRSAFYISLLFVPIRSARKFVYLNTSASMNMAGFRHLQLAAATSGEMRSRISLPLLVDMSGVLSSPSSCVRLSKVKFESELKIFCAGEISWFPSLSSAGGSFRDRLVWTSPEP